MTIHDVIRDPNSKWLEKNGPAEESVFKSFLSRSPQNLPHDYIEFIKNINGGEGDLAIEPGWFQLWRLQDVYTQNQGYQVGKYYPEYFCFGSSGGGVMFAFKKDGSTAVYGIPFDSIDQEDIQIVAEDFLTFARAMGYPLD